jgi:hypothetical protein
MFTHKFPPRTATWSSNHRIPLRALYAICREAEGLVKAEQNIPIAKLCVYTSTGFSEGFK